MKKSFLLKALISGSLFINTPLWSLDTIEAPHNIGATQLETEELEFVQEYWPQVRYYLEKLSGKYEWASTLLTDIEEPQTPNTLWHLILRAQAGQSVGRISRQERAFYQTLAPLDEFIEKLVDQEAWKTKDASKILIDEFMKFTPNLTMNKSMQNSSHGDVSKNVKIIPCLNKAFLDPLLLLERTIKEEYLIGVPMFLQTRPLKAHSIENLSPLGFTLHDFTHALFDQRQSDLYFAGMRQAVGNHESIKLIQETINAHNFVVKQYLLNILGLIKMNPSEHKQHIAGFFLVMHEIFNSFKGTFHSEQKTLSGVLESMKTQQFSSIEDLATHDPFNTNIGEIQPERNPDWYLQLIRDFYNFRSDSSNPEELSVKASSLFIHIHYAKGPMSVSHRFPTLHYKYLDAMDNLRILNMADEPVEFSLLDLADDTNKEEAITRINTINEKLRGYVDGFLDWAIAQAKEKYDAQYQEEISQIYDHMQKKLHPS